VSIETAPRFGCYHLESRAEVLTPTLVVDGKEITAKYNCSPSVVGPWCGVSRIGGTRITSNEAFYLPTVAEKGDHCRRRLQSVPSSPASFMASGRSEQLYWGPLFLRGFDDDCRKTLAEEMKKKGGRPEIQC